MHIARTQCQGSPAWTMMTIQRRIWLRWRKQIMNLTTDIYLKLLTVSCEFSAPKAASMNSLWHCSRSAKRSAERNPYTQTERSAGWTGKEAPKQGYSEYVRTIYALTVIDAKTTIHSADRPMPWGRPKPKRRVPYDSLRVNRFSHVYREIGIPVP